MLPPDSLKRILHEQHKPLVKLLSILATADTPASISQITDRAKDAGFNIPRSWNVSTALARSKGKAIRTPAGWELQPAGKAYLTEFGIDEVGQPQSSAQIALNK